MNKVINQILSKKTLYILCFMVLNLIDMLKTSQSGAVWYVAVNCTGLVMLVIIVSAWPLRDFLTVGNGIYTAVCAAAMILVGIYWRPTTGQFVLWQIQTAIMNVWWIGIVVVYLFRKAVIQKTLPFRPGLMGWLWIAMSILMIFSASQRLWPLWYFLMFGSFYLTSYKPEDKKALFEAMVDGTIISFFCIQIYAYGFRPYDEVRYKGATGNCNMTALYYLIVYMMCLYKLHFLELKKAHKGWKLFYLIGAGGMLSFQLFTMGRTAWVASLVLTILYGILVVGKLWRKTWKQVLCRGGALALTAMMTFLPVYYSIRWLPTILHHPIWYEGEYSISKVHSFDPANSDKYVDLDEFLETLLERIQHTFENVVFRDPFVLRVKAMDLDQMEHVDVVDVPWVDDALRGRLTIYKAYLEDLTLFGHGLSDGYYVIGDGPYYSWHAQNLWIQIAYTYGIPAGILLVVLTFVMLSVHKKTMEKIKAFYAVIPFFICVLTFMFGIMELVWNPGQLVMFLFFFVQHPQFRTEVMADGIGEEVFHG